MNTNRLLIAAAAVSLFAGTSGALAQQEPPRGAPAEKIAPKPGAPERWPMATVIGRLAGGDLFYVVSALGEPIFCQRYRCWCGTESLRTTADEGALEPLEALESCDWEQGSAERALPPFTIALDRRQLGSSTRG